MSETRSRILPALVAVAGPLTLGAALGLPHGWRPLLLSAATLPAVLAGLMLAMAPALYVAASLTGVAPPAERFAAAVGRALWSSGTVLLGVAPPAFLLAATTPAGGATPLLLGLAALGPVIALLLLGRQFVSGSGPAASRAGALFVGWAAISSVIGVCLVGRLLHA